MNAEKHREALPSHSGGYPIIYLTARDEVLCAACATSQEHGEPVNCGIHWEGDPVECDGCGEEIESAYGPIEESSE